MPWAAIHLSGVPLISFDVRSLNLLQRVLLVNDGTLTDALEAALLQRITLVKIAVDVAVAAAPIESLELDAGAPLMSRKILLRGEETGTNYVYAETLIALDRLSPELRDQLVNTNNPVGRLWVEHRLETRKEILKMWRAPVGELSGYFGVPAETELLARSYRVFSAQRPIMLITEYFLIDLVEPT